MERAGADFSGVSTLNLVRRALNRIAMMEVIAINQPFTVDIARKRRLRQLSKQAEQIVKKYEDICKGKGSEEEFRAQLTEFLNPHASRRTTRRTFRPRH